MKKSLALIPAAALIAALALTGCSTTGTATGDKAPVADTKTSAPAAAAPAAPTTAKFGETWKYKDGVTVSVSAPAPYTPGQYAAGATQAQQIALTFTITNGSAKNLDPLVSPKVSSAGTEAGQIIDVENQQVSAGFPPTTVILPGGNATWTTAYSVADATKLIVQLSPAVIKYDDAIFTNTQ